MINILQEHCSLSRNEVNPKWIRKLNRDNSRIEKFAPTKRWWTGSKNLISIITAKVEIPKAMVYEI